MSINTAFKEWQEKDTNDSREEFGKELIKYCEAIVRNKYQERLQYADDAIGDAILRIWQRIPSFDSKKASFSTWARTVIINTCKNESRNRARRNEMQLFENSATYDGGLGGIDAKVMLHQIVAKLEKSDQEIVALYLEGCTQEEIGEKIGKPTKYVENTWLRRIIPRLQELAK
jgi:RNA polymerase sigma factor (sigma-70 family)